jgi:2-octaprenyl-6-methoxyphenol hydroxylase
VGGAPEKAGELVAMPNRSSSARCRKPSAGERSASRRLPGDRASPLALRVRTERAGAREAFVGNSAQTLHPVAGQGLNLGLRDAWELAQSIGDVPDPGAAEVLSRFARQRRLDALATIRVTDLLAELFVGTSPAARAARGAAMCALDASLRPGDSSPAA